MQTQNTTFVPHIAAQGFDAQYVTDVELDLAGHTFTFKYGSVAYWGKLTSIGLIKKNSIRKDRS